MRTSIRIGLAGFIVLTIFWITSELRGLNSRWMPIDDTNLSPSRTRPQGDSGAKQELVKVVDGLASISGLPVAGKPISSPAGHGSSEATDVSKPDDKAKANDPTELPEDKIVVIGKLKKESTDWVKKGLSDWQQAVYTLDDRSAQLHTSTKKGNEANAFLTYIIDNYQQLPSTIAFVHSKRFTEDKNKKGDKKKLEGPGFDNVASLNKLSLDFIQRNGYANLRCVTSPGCPDEIQPFRNNTEQTDIDHTMSTVWGQFFDSQEVPDVIATPCCGQFVVSKKQVRERPLDDYVRFQKWLLETPLEDTISTQIFEYLWHIIFGQKPVHCPAKDKCLKDLYGGS